MTTPTTKLAMNTSTYEECGNISLIGFVSALQVAVNSMQLKRCCHHYYVLENCIYFANQLGNCTIVVLLIRISQLCRPRATSKKEYLSLFVVASIFDFRSPN